MPKHHLKFSYKKDSTHQKLKKIKFNKQVDVIIDTAIETTDTADSDYYWDNADDLQ